MRRRELAGPGLLIPGSHEIYSTAAREGLLEVFPDACVTVLVSTQHFNDQRRNGSRLAEVVLASAPAVAVAGKITDPRALSAVPAEGAIS